MGNAGRKIGIWCMAGITVLSLGLSSCGGLFTTSLTTMRRTDYLKDAYAGISASDLANMTDTAVTTDDKKNLLEALKDKKEELSNLPMEQKESILNLATDTTLSMDVISSAAKVFKDLGAASPDSIDISEVAKVLYDKIPSDVDTTVLCDLLSDPAVVGSGGASIETVALAAVALFAQTIRDEPSLAPENIQGNFDKVKDVITDTTLTTPEAIIGALNGITISSKTADCILALSLALQTIEDDPDRQEELENVTLGGFSIKDLLPSKGGAA